ncbi:MAG TPA: hypothetical protein VKO84_04135 [Gaiellaceae bacterium]|nr:hypothetical protein [Gaiellaceae bacterium]
MGIKNPVGVGLGLLIGAAIGFALVFSPWVLVGLIGLTISYGVFAVRRRA